MRERRANIDINIDKLPDVIRDRHVATFPVISCRSVPLLTFEERDSFGKEEFKFRKLSKLLNAGTNLSFTLHIIVVVIIFVTK